MEKFYVTKKVMKEVKKPLSKKASEILSMRIQDFVEKYWTESRAPKELKQDEIYTTRYKTIRYGELEWTGRKFEPKHRRYERKTIKLETVYDLITLENVSEFMWIGREEHNSLHKKTGIGEGSRKNLDKILAPYGLKFGMEIEKEEG